MLVFGGAGGRTNEARIQVDGLNTGAAFNGAGVSSYVPDIGNAQEISMTTSGGLGEAEVGGPSFSIVPKTGGNTFKGSLYASNVTSGMVGNNYTDDLIARGLTTPGALTKLWDYNVGVGGPIKQDRVWFFVQFRDEGSHRTVPGMFRNANMGDPTRWTYVTDTSRPAVQAGSWRNGALRLTVQPTARNKFNLFWDEQHPCQGCGLARRRRRLPSIGAERNHLRSTGVFKPVVQRDVRTRSGTYPNPLRPACAASDVDVAGHEPSAARGWYRDLSEPVGWERNARQSGAERLHSCGRAVRERLREQRQHRQPHVSVGHLAGELAGHAHVARVRFVRDGRAEHEGRVPGRLPGRQLEYLRTQPADPAYRFNNGVPNQVTETIDKFPVKNRVRYDALYAQEQWTKGRVTLQGALRYDRAWSWFPEVTVGPSRFLQTAVTYPETPGVTGYNDITPRGGIALDLFGTGKTSLKINAGKYLQAAQNGLAYGALRPSGRLTTTVSRTWTDRDSDYVVDCDLTSSLAQSTTTDFCAQISTLNFGKDVFTSDLDVALRNGWGIRPADWQIGVSVQQEVLPRVSIEVGYNRRWLTNFTVVDNVLNGAADFGTFSITAPSDSRLPADAQGQVISGSLQHQSRMSPR